MIDASSARASRSAHGFPRGFFAPRSFHTVLSLALGNLGPLLDDLFVSPHFQLGRSASLCHCGLLSPVSSASQMGYRTGVNSSRTVCCSQDRLHLTSSHLCLNLLDSGGLTYVRLCACSHASPRMNLHSWDLLGDLPSPISGTSKMFAIASHQSSQQTVAWALSLAFCTCCVLLRAISLMTCAYSATDRSTNFWKKVQGLICWRRTRSLHLSECAIASGWGHRLRVVHVFVCEGIAHVWITSASLTACRNCER